MSTTYQRRYKINNGTDYDEYHFVTEAELVKMTDGTNVENKLKCFATTNSNNAYSVTITGISSLYNGLSVYLIFNANSNGAITLNINSLGPKNVLDYYGNAVINVTTNLPAHLIYSNGNFILLGKGGGGNAQAIHLLSGETATVDSGQIIGSMANNGVISGTISNQGQSISIPEGYTKGGSINANFANLIASNIKKDVNIGGIVGELTIASLGGKKWTSGTSSTSSFTVNNLTFQPKLIFVFIDFAHNGCNNRIYDYYNLYSPHNLSTWGNGICIYESDYNVNNGINSTNVKDVNTNGFTYQASISSSAILNQPITWIAIE